MVDAYLYDHLGYRLKHIPPHIMEQHDLAVETCRSNSAECQKIIDAYFTNGIHKKF